MGGGCCGAPPMANFGPCEMAEPTDMMKELQKELGRIQELIYEEKAKLKAKYGLELYVSTSDYPSYGLTYPRYHREFSVSATHNGMDI